MRALLADPRDGRLVLVTKGIAGGVGYAVPPPVWPGPAAPAVTVRTVAPRAGSGSPPLPTRRAELVRLARVGL